jgi:hypothetical protein
MNGSNSIVRFFLILFYVFLLATISWYINGKSFIGIDDANIYMIYMKNFSEGHGFVYNVGGERVEGFTSLLWTLLGALIFRVFSSPEIMLLLLNLMITTATFFFIINYLEKVNGDNAKIINSYSLLFLAAIGSTPGFIDWTIVSLMETGLWTMLITVISIKILSYESTHRKRNHYIIINFLIFLLFICRPEAMLVAPFLIVLNGFQEFQISKSFKPVLTGFFITIFVSAIVLTSLILWRYWYFGFPFPNTYYAKFSVDWVGNLKAGIKYLYSMVIEKPYILGVWMLSVFVVFRSALKNNLEAIKNFVPLLLICSVFFLVPLYSGGDHFRFHRFVVPVFPLVILLLIQCIKFYFGSINMRILTGVSILIFFSCSYNLRDLYYHKNVPLRHEWDIAVAGRKGSEKLNKLFIDAKKFPTQGVLVAGGTAFSYHGFTIDLLGLNNSKMAHANKIKDENLTKNHASFNIDVFFELNPDIFWHKGSRFVKSSEPIPSEIYVIPNLWISKVFKNIQLDTRFKDRYGFYRITNSKSNDEALEIFARKDFIYSLDKSIYSVSSIDYR